MPAIKGFEIFAVDLPFKKPFKHAAAERSGSCSILLKCVTDEGRAGFGECLPREYVTGESRDEAFALLEQKILPHLLGRRFESLEEVVSWLDRRDGRAPPDWVDPGVPQGAAWCAVDLALLDTFGRAFDEPVRLNAEDCLPQHFRYSVVLSADKGINYLKTLLKVRLFQVPQVKLKLGKEGGERAVRTARRVLGPRCGIRVDANMAWDTEEAVRIIAQLKQCGVQSVEQPLKADDLAGSAVLVKESGQAIMADESFTDKESLQSLIEKKAFSSLNVRISKCGGLVAAWRRCLEGLRAGLILQLGCQVGETSLLSAAQLVLAAAVRDIRYAEGCFGHLLLKEDPATPCLQFGFRGLPPALPDAPGLGADINEATLRAHTARSASVEEG